MKLTNLDELLSLAQRETVEFFEKRGCSIELFKRGPEYHAVLKQGEHKLTEGSGTTPNYAVRGLLASWVRSGHPMAV